MSQIALKLTKSKSTVSEHYQKWATGSFWSTSGGSDGVFTSGQTKGAYIQIGNATYKDMQQISFDLSKQIRTADETRPMNYSTIWYVKAK